VTSRQSPSTSVYRPPWMCTGALGESWPPRALTSNRSTRPGRPPRGGTDIDRKITDARLPSTLLPQTSVVSTPNVSTTVRICLRVSPSASPPATMSIYSYAAAVSGVLDPIRRPGDRSIRASHHAVLAPKDDSNARAGSPGSRHQRGRTRHLERRTPIPVGRLMDRFRLPAKEPLVEEGLVTITRECGSDTLGWRGWAWMIAWKLVPSGSPGRCEPPGASSNSLVSRSNSRSWRCRDAVRPSGPISATPRLAAGSVRMFTANDARTRADSRRRREGRHFDGEVERLLNREAAGGSRPARPRRRRCCRRRPRSRRSRPTAAPPR